MTITDRNAGYDGVIGESELLLVTVAFRSTSAEENVVKTGQYVHCRPPDMSPMRST
jgi:hypothetical protein